MKGCRMSRERRPVWGLGVRVRARVSCVRVAVCVREGLCEGGSKGVVTVWVEVRRVWVGGLGVRDDREVDD